MIYKRIENKIEYKKRLRHEISQTKFIVVFITIIKIYIVHDTL